MNLAKLINFFFLICLAPVLGLAQGFTENVISDASFRGFSVYAADIDGDGDMDVLGADIANDEIAWFENNGSGSFSAKKVIGSIDAPYSVYAADVDRDGDMDVLAAANRADLIVWYENDGNDPIGWTRNTIAGLDNAATVYAADVDGDGDMDVLGGAKGGAGGVSGADKIVLYENDGSGGFSVKTEIDNNSYTTSVIAADINNDGDMDVLGASEQSPSKIAWYENDGNENFVEYAIDASPSSGGKSVYAAHINNDGHMDVLASSLADNAIVWYENDGSNPIVWTKRTIDNAFNGPQSVYAVDVDGDGDMDVLGAASGANEIAWYENNGSGSFSAKQLIGSSFDGYSVYASNSSDFDDDGELDVLGGANAEGISWFESPGFAPTISSVSLNAANSELTVTFSENVYNTNGGSGDLEVADFALSISSGAAGVNATPGSITKTAQNIWVLGVTITGTADGDEVLTVVPAAGNAIYDAVGNAASTTQSNNTASLTEKVLPTISSVSLNAANSELTVTFSENVYNTNGGSGDLEVADFALSISSGAAGVNATPGSITKTAQNIWVLGVTITGTADGDEVLTVVPAAGNAIYDAVGNAASTTQSNNTASLTEKVLPTISSVSLNAANSELTVTFSENVYNTNGGSGDLEVADFALSISSGAAGVNATPGSITKTAQNIWVLGVTITGTADGDEVLTVVPAAGNAIYDAVGNAASTTQSNNTASLTEKVLPTISSVSLNAANSELTVTFSENVYNTNGGSGDLEVADFALSISSGAAGVNATPGSITKTAQNIWVLGVTITGTADGDEVLTVVPAAGNAIYDAVGNAASTTQSNNTASLTEKVLPTIALSSSAANLKAGETATITFTISESVSDFVIGDITVSGGTLDSFTGSGTSYTVVFTPDASSTANGVISVADTKFTDAAGNTNADSGDANNTETITVDTVLPTITGVTSTTANGSYKPDDIIPITVGFNEVVNVTGTPQLTLETGSSDAVVNYSSGTGTNTLTFNYTVGSDHTTSDLDYVATSSLALPEPNPGTPVYEDTSGDAEAITVSGNYAYVADGTSGLAIIDISDPTSPGTPVYKATSYKAKSVTVSGNYAYVIDQLSGLAIIDISDPTNPGSPSYTATNANSGTALAVAVSGDYAYVAANVAGLVTINISDPTSPGTPVYKDTNGNSMGITVSGNYAYVADKGAGLAIFDISNPASPGTPVYVDTNGEARGVAISGNYAYVADKDAGLAIIDISDPTNPGNPVYIDTNGEAKNVYVQGNYAYVADKDAGLAIIDISDPTNPGNPIYKSTTGEANATTVEGNYTYLADKASGLAIIPNNVSTIKDAALNSAILTLATPGATNSLGANKALVIDTTVPTVTRVTSTTANGSYKSDDVIAITVEFSEVVNVTGTPQLTLETGSSDAVVDYSSGSGSNTLTFNYTVASDHTTSDLDYVATSSLALNSGTIKDAALNAATLTLASPGATNSLGANKAIVVDNTVPIITNVSSSTADGSYKVGDVIAVNIVFSEVVNVTGTPQLTLETGSSDAVVDYSSGSGSNTLTFNYTVASDHTTSDLDYLGTSSLALNSGTIKDAALNAATLTLASPGAVNSLSTNKDILVDGTVPTVTGVTSTISNGTYSSGDVIPITIGFSEIVNVTGTPQLTLETGNSDAVVNYSSGTGTNTLTFNYTVSSDHTTSDLDYLATNSLALNSGTIKDEVGNISILTLPSTGASNSLGASKAIVIESTVAIVADVSSTASNGFYKVGNVIPITVEFSELVNVTGTPQLSLKTKENGTTAGDGQASVWTGSSKIFTKGNNTNPTIESNQDRITDKVWITRANNEGGQIYNTVSESASNKNISPSGTEWAEGEISNYASLNYKSFRSATGKPKNAVGKTYVVHLIEENIYLSLRFISWSGGRLGGFSYERSTNNTSTNETRLDYTSGSGTNTLTFNYTVASDHTTSDLDYVATSSLTLNGGTIKDAEGNAVSLTLASPGTSGSLGANKTIVIDNSVPTMSITANEGVDGFTSNDSALSLTFTTSEAITDFIIEDITVTGGTMSAFEALNDTIYTATFTPSAEGVKVIGVAAGTYKDVAGNENIAAVQFNWTYNVEYSPQLLDATFTLAENSPNGRVVGTIEASDADGDTLSYIILSGNTGQAFGLDAITGVLSVVDSSALDYEITPVFSLLVKASDGALSDSATVSVNLTDVDEDSTSTNKAPTIEAATFSLAENSPIGTVVGTIEASDADGDTLSYTILSGNTGQAFGLDAITGVLSVVDSSALDYEITAVFSLLVKASDGALSDSATVTVNLTDVDEDSTSTNKAPTIEAATFSLAENSPIGTVVGTIEASDPDGDTLSYTILSGNTGQTFGLDNTIGQLTVANSNALDYEVTPVFNLLIKASDGVLSDSVTFTVNLTDIDEEEEPLSLADASEMIYPNPTDGIINIKMAEFKEATIYNLSGKRIMRSRDNRIDVSSLSEGVYIIKLENGSGDLFSTRLIKE